MGHEESALTGPGSPMLSWAELERLVGVGDVDTVIVAFTDMQGRLTCTKEMGTLPNGKTLEGKN